MTNDPDAKVLGYHDVLLRVGDVDLLRGPHWLNDQVITFAFEHLQRDIHAQTGDLCLVGGAVSYFLANGAPGDVGGIAGPLGLAGKGLSLLAVNDNPFVDQAGGGSHWSLLAYHRAGNEMVHYDSGGGGNDRAARRLALLLGPYVAAEGGGGGPPSFRSADSPQQSNGHDCGVFVIATARALCRAHAEGQDPAAAVRRDVGPGAVAAMRGELVSLIEGLAAEEEEEGGG